MNSAPRKKERIDKLIVEQGLVSTRARAQAMILAGHVIVNDVPVTKAGEMVALNSTIRLREPELKYVSRGALKLKAALEAFSVSSKGKICIDIGSSTGGFTEILLEGGALRVHALDSGSNQLAWKLRNDARVHSQENFNARHLKPEDLKEQPEVLVMDVSFISIKLILPAAVNVLAPHSDLVVLFKPQFEVGREWVGEGGIVKDQEHAKKVREEVIRWAECLGLRHCGTIDSPIQGTDGNHEYLIHWKARDK
ncbi:MAG: TlyA family RNA methyltransferase [Bdellovibrionales bacterium]|nr:TlyA family RNA methyltransferase [Oligoflexia bacterium]